MKIFKKYFLIFKNNFNSIMLYPLFMALAVLMSKGISDLWRLFLLVLVAVILFLMQMNYFKGEKKDKNIN